MEISIEINGKEITTNTEFRKAINYSLSGTRYILAEIDGKEVTLRKHWSHDGKEWDVWSGHQYETMQRLGKSVVMELLGEPLWYTNEEGDERRDVYVPFVCDYGHHNVKFYITKD